MTVDKLSNVLMTYCTDNNNNKKKNIANRTDRTVNDVRTSRG